MSGHVDTKQCDEGDVRRVQHEASATFMQALEVRFTAYGEELANVEVFHYLGRLLSYDDNNSQAVNSNLKKA